MLIDQGGRFSGYASIFGLPDQGGDVVMPGAFGQSLLNRGGNGIRLLFQHDPKEPVGRILELAEDNKGLAVSGQLLTGDPRARSLEHLIAGGALDGLSIGFRTIRATKDQRTGHRKLWQVDLWEISIVTFPMMERARIYPVAKPPDPPVRPVQSPQQTIAAAISLIRNL
jgi:Escherichia/Staphylococcus phage prohead protease